MRIYYDVNLEDFEFWGGAKERARSLTVREFRIIEKKLKELYPDGINETRLNSIFWFCEEMIEMILEFSKEGEKNEKKL